MLSVKICIHECCKYHTYIYLYSKVKINIINLYLKKLKINKKL